MSDADAKNIPASKEALAAGHEIAEIHPKPIVISLVVLAVFSAASFLVIVVLFNYLLADAAKRSPQPSTLAKAAALNRQAPEPRLQVDAWKDWRDYKQMQDRTLERYSWVDKDSSIVRLPIDRAMEMIVERGLPHRTTLSTNPPGGDVRDAAHPEEGGRMAPPGSMQMHQPKPSTEPAHKSGGRR